MVRSPETFQALVSLFVSSSTGSRSVRCRPQVLLAAVVLPARELAPQQTQGAEEAGRSGRGRVRGRVGRQELGLGLGPLLFLALAQQGRGEGGLVGGRGVGDGLDHFASHLTVDLEAVGDEVGHRDVGAGLSLG